MGIKTVPHRPYSPDLAPDDFWLFPKFKGNHYQRIEEMQEAVTKVIDTLTQEDFHGAFQNRASVFEWHKRLKEGRESVRDDERCGSSKEVRTPELISQRVRVRVTMLRFYGNSGRDSVRRGQRSSSWVSGIDRLIREDFHGAFHRSLEWYNKFIAYYQVNFKLITLRQG